MAPVHVISPQLTYLSWLDYSSITRQTHLQSHKQLSRSLAPRTDFTNSDAMVSSDVQVMMPFSCMACWKGLPKLSVTRMTY